MAADDVVELAAELVAIDSVNPDLMASAAGEEGVARHVAGWCAAAGLDVVVDEAAPGRPNVVAVARGSGGGRSLLLNAHTDTVGVGHEKGALRRRWSRPHARVVLGSAAT